MLDRAAEDDGYARDLYAASRESVLFWINAFVWTFRQKVTDLKTGQDRMAFKDENRGVNEVDVPFVTWPVQDDAISMTYNLIINGGDGLINKSRDMGATWLLTAVFHHLWTFGENVSILWVSATASDVDLHPKINPDTVFYKHDYLDFWLPEWMRPPINRVNMHRGNMLKRNSMDGEATTGNVGRGGRRTVIGFDEFAAVDDGFGMLEASADTTATRIFNSTPKGPGTAFTHVYNSARAGKSAISLINLPWWEHPDKGRNRQMIEDKNGNMKYTSPWYRKECLRRSSPKEIAQNLDMDHLCSGDRFYDGPVLESHKSAFCRRPLFEANLDFSKKYNIEEIEQFVSDHNTSKIKLRKTAKDRPWKFWIDMVNDKPDQSFSYLFGIDISNGQGASNSVISVRCVDTGEKVAEFADANTPPHDLARIASAAGLFFGCKGCWPQIVYESNGPGGIFGKVLIGDMHYPNVYLEMNLDTLNPTKGNKPGWHSNRQKKEDLLGFYRKALARGDFINPCEEAMDEAGEYIYYEGGGIGPAKLIKESDQARSTHGDRVIADALTCIGLLKMPKSKSNKPSEPGGTWSARRSTYRRRRKGKSKRWERRANSHRR